MEKWWILFILGINTWYDLKKREVNLCLVLLLLIYGISKMIWKREMGFADFLPMVISILFPGISILSSGGIGMGDSILILAMGSVLDLSEYLIFLCFSMIFASLWAVFLIGIRKKGRKTEIPMVPFLFLGYVGGLILCG